MVGPGYGLPSKKTYRKLRRENMIRLSRGENVTEQLGLSLRGHTTAGGGKQAEMIGHVRGYESMMFSKELQASRNLLSQQT